MMKLLLLLLAILAVMVQLQECHGKPLVGRPRRRLTDVVADVEQQEPDDPAAAVTAAMTCDGQLSQSVVQLKQQVTQLEQEYNVALETIQRLEQEKVDAKVEYDRVVEDRKTVVTTLLETRRQHSEEVSEAYDRKQKSLAALTRAKDGSIQKLQEHIVFLEEQQRLLQEQKESGGDVHQQQELMDRLVKVQEEAQAREAALKDQLEQQSQEMTQLMEAAKQEAEKVLTEQLAAIKEEMKDVKGRSAAEIAKTQEAVKELQTKNQQKEMETKKLMQSNEAMEQVSGIYVFHFGHVVGGTPLPNPCLHLTHFIIILVNNLL